MKRFLRGLGRWAALLLAVVVVFAGVQYYRDKAPANAPMGEYVWPDEDYYTAEIISAAVQMANDNRAALLEAGKTEATDQKSAPGFSVKTYRRDVHVKSHGCVAANFEVNDVEDRLRYGIFGQRKTYDAVIRFSSGKPSLQKDQVKDARGMAIKVLNVPGPKVLTGHEDDGTQDFIMINSPTFFIRTLEEYAAFSKALGKGDKAAMMYFLGNGSFFNFSQWHLRQMKLALSTFKPMPESLTTTRFWSLSAYSLGPAMYVKYSARPCAANKVAAKRPDKNDADYLRKELAQHADAGDSCFELMVQPQVLNANMPIEDTTVEWDEKKSPFIPVAKVTFKPWKDLSMNSAEVNTRCENLSFNPWHALPDHRPVGVMNRVRKALYLAMGDYRRTKNCESFCAEKCTANCTTGCYSACVASCPLLNDPAPLNPPLPDGACTAPPQLTSATPAVPVRPAAIVR